MEQVVIIGTGCAGWTAAIYTGRANLSPLVLSGTQLGGQLTTTTEVENFPGFPEGVMGPELMGRMQQQAEKFGARVEYKKVEAIEKNSDGTFTLKTDGGGEVQTQTVIIATGAAPRYLGLENEMKLVGHGVTSCATCDGAFYRDVPVAVVGGGDSACEEANFLTRFASKVYLVHRRDELRASKIMADRVLANEKVEPIWNSGITEYLTDEAGEVRAVTMENLQTGEKSELESVSLWPLAMFPTRSLLEISSMLMRTDTLFKIPVAPAPRLPGFLPPVMWPIMSTVRPSRQRVRDVLQPLRPSDTLPTESRSKI